MKLSWATLPACQAFRFKEGLARGHKKAAKRDLEAAQHGNILRDHDFFPRATTPEARRYCMHGAQCNDGVEIHKNKSYTPVTMQILDWPQEQRTLLGSTWLLAVFPPGIKDYQALMRPIAQSLADVGPDSEGVDIVDLVDNTPHKARLAVAW
jgi:hypothetical protein